MFCRIRCRRQALICWEFRGLFEVWPGDRTFFHYASLNQMWNLLNAFPRPSCSGGVAGSYLSWPDIMILPHWRSPGYSTAHRESWEANSGSALIRPWQARSPFRWQQPVLFPRPAHVSSPVLSLQVCGKAVLPFSFCSLACLLAFFQGI